jgi:hypothetical protein
MKTKVIQFGLIGVVMLLLLSGCKTIRGGGWINSKTGEGKATFGISLECKNAKIHGGFTYLDHGQKYKMPDGKMKPLSLKAWVDRDSLMLSGGSCKDQFLGEQSPNHAAYQFIYRARPDKFGEEGKGTGTINFWDANRSEHPDENDRLCIDIVSGPYANYSNCGDLGGGNLTIL